MPRAPGRPSFDPAAGYDSSSQQPPEASSTFSSASADLPNGMPQLPADLTLEGPTLVGVPNAGQQQQQQHDLDVPAQQQQQQSVINFGGLSRYGLQLRGAFPQGQQSTRSWLHLCAVCVLVCQHAEGYSCLCCPM